MTAIRSAPASLLRGAFAALAVLSCSAAAAPVLSQDIPRRTYTYKTIGDLEIKADVYARDAAGDAPVVVWIHGGALIVGHREWIDTDLVAGLVKAGAVVVSIDYRLAPETLLPEIITDIEDAFDWVREEGPALFGADPDRVAVMGMSAGGYLTLLSGYRIEPRPAALVSYCGYGDLIGDWYSEPSPHPRHHQTQLTRAEAYDQVDGPPVSDSRDREGEAFGFYGYLRQQGEWPVAVSGWDPDRESGRFEPYMPLVNVTEHFPPTLMIHGTIDTDVPYEQATLMAEQLEANAVEHRLITLPGVEHCLEGATEEQVQEVREEALAFALSRLSRGASPPDRRPRR